MYRRRNAVKPRLSNIALILKTIKKEAPISRTELAKITNLSNPAVGNIVASLLSLGLVRETGVVTGNTGRSRIMLGLNDDAAHCIGIEISRSGVSGIISNISGRILHRAEHFYGAEETHGVVRHLFAVIEELLAFGEAKRLHMIGIGIGTPGPLDADSGLVFDPPNFPGYANVNLKKLVQERYNLSCHIEDDARTSCLGEAWFGAGVQASSIVFVSMGEGIGSGVIFDDYLYRGAHGIAGQVGHFVVELNGVQCDCGNIGCLETVASTSALVENARQTSSALKELPDLDVLDSLVSDTRQGAPYAQELWTKALQYLTVAVVSVVNSYDPEVLILGGRLVSVYPEIVDRIKIQVARRCYLHISNDLHIVKSQLACDSATLGAGALVLEWLFHDPVTATKESKRHVGFR